MKNLSHTVVKLKYILEAQKSQRQFIYRKLKLSWEQMARPATAARNQWSHIFKFWRVVMEFNFESRSS